MSNQLAQRHPDLTTRALELVENREMIVTSQLEVVALVALALPGSEVIRGLALELVLLSTSDRQNERTGRPSRHMKDGAVPSDLLARQL
jgi:hypothetical protein